MSKTGHLFSVDILIESTSNGLALEKLIQLLNSPEIKDYKIKRGIELGKIIDASVREQERAAAKAAKPTAGGSAFIAQIEAFKAENKLVRLTVVKAKGIKLSIPCRILHIDEAAQLVSVYHVDEKKVYSFKLNEIDDLQVG